MEKIIENNVKFRAKEFQFAYLFYLRLKIKVTSNLINNLYM